MKQESPPIRVRGDSPVGIPTPAQPARRVVACIEIAYEMVADPIGKLPTGTCAVDPQPVLALVERLAARRASDRSH